jgi:hypothetical protein
MRHLNEIIMVNLDDPNRRSLTTAGLVDVGLLMGLGGPGHPACRY